MTHILDQQLNSLFFSLLDRLSTSQEGLIKLPPALMPGWNDEAIVPLTQAGLIKEAPALQQTICPGCEHCCIMPVEYITGGNKAYILCDKRDDIGRVFLPLEDLRTSNFSLEILAQMLAVTLATDRKPQEAISKHLWFLGKAKVGRKNCSFFLGRVTANNAIWQNQHFIEHQHPILLTLNTVKPPENITAITLGNVLSFRNGAARLDHQALQHIINKHNTPTEDNLFIRFDEDDNRVILNDDYELARTRLESENAKVIDYLCKNPNRMIAYEELQSACGIVLSKSLHAIVQRLGFTGKLKRAFFTVSKNQLKLHNPVDSFRLKELGIKRAEILKNLKTL